MRTFKVQGMSCGHCQRAITQALLELDADARVEVDLAAGEVRIDSGLDDAKVIAAIVGQGFQASHG